MGPAMSWCLLRMNLVGTSRQGSASVLQGMVDVVTAPAEICGRRANVASYEYVAFFVPGWMCPCSRDMGESTCWFL